MKGKSEEVAFLSLNLISYRVYIWVVTNSLITKSSSYLQKIGTSQTNLPTQYIYVLVFQLTYSILLPTGRLNYQLYQSFKKLTISP